MATTCDTAKASKVDADASQREQPSVRTEGAAARKSSYMELCYFLTVGVVAAKLSANTGMTEPSKQTMAAAMRKVAAAITAQSTDTKTTAVPPLESVVFSVPDPDKLPAQFPVSLADLFSPTPFGPTKNSGLRQSEINIILRLRQLHRVPAGCQATEYAYCPLISVVHYLATLFIITRLGETCPQLPSESKRSLDHLMLQLDRVVAGLEKNLRDRKSTWGESDLEGTRQGAVLAFMAVVARVLINNFCSAQSSKDHGKAFAGLDLRFNQLMQCVDALKEPEIQDFRVLKILHSPIGLLYFQQMMTHIASIRAQCRHENNLDCDSATMIRFASEIMTPGISSHGYSPHLRHGAGPAARFAGGVGMDMSTTISPDSPVLDKLSLRHNRVPTEVLNASLIGELGSFFKNQAKRSRDTFTIWVAIAEELVKTPPEIQFCSPINVERRTLSHERYILEYATALHSTVELIATVKATSLCDYHAAPNKDDKADATREQKTQVDFAALAAKKQQENLDTRALQVLEPLISNAQSQGPAFILHARLEFWMGIGKGDVGLLKNAAKKLNRIASDTSGASLEETETRLRELTEVHKALAAWYANNAQNLTGEDFDPVLNVFKSLQHHRKALKLFKIMCSRSPDDVEVREALAEQLQLAAESWKAVGLVKDAPPGWRCELILALHRRYGVLREVNDIIDARGSEESESTTASTGRRPVSYDRLDGLMSACEHIIQQLELAVEGGPDDPSIASPVASIRDEDDGFQTEITDIECDAAARIPILSPVEQQAAGRITWQLYKATLAHYKAELEQYANALENFVCATHKAVDDVWSSGQVPPSLMGSFLRDIAVKTWAE